MSQAISALPVLRGARTVLRPVTPGDVGRLAEILADSSVARWWGHYDLDRTREDFLADDVAVFVIETTEATRARAVAEPAGPESPVGSAEPRAASPTEPAGTGATIKPGGEQFPIPEVAGCIQYGEENEPDYRHASIDIFVAAEHQGRGLGTDALRTLARHLFEDRGHHRLTIDPAAANERAISAYRKVGFRPVGIMRSYERSPEGEWRDGLLMDLLREDLT